jgi:3-oxoacyl-[acyl-carrier-protein] synthase-1
MWVNSIHIAATGARTPVGLQTASAAAAVRAGIAALGEHPFMIDQAGEPMPGALDSELDPDLMGPERLLALTEAALREACLPLSGRLEDLSRVPIILGLSELRPGFTNSDAERVRTGLTRFKGLPVQISEVNVLTNGHAAGFLALSHAAAQMQQGRIEVCLAGGVDSYFHPDTMEWLDENRQLTGSVSRSGFIPGEGAGFCLLMTGHACRRLGIMAPMQVRAVATGKETKLIKTEEVCLGEGLTATVRQALGALGFPERRINGIICDMNGERYRGEEWGFVCLRLGQFFDDPTGYVSPAECWGDMGAASGPLFAMLACQAAARGYSAGPRTLLWASSEGGDRGAAVLEAGGDLP